MTESREDPTNTAETEGAHLKDCYARVAANKQKAKTTQSELDAINKTIRNFKNTKKQTLNACIRIKSKSKINIAWRESHTNTKSDYTPKEEKGSDIQQK